MNMHAYLKKIPKSELHVHIEGAISIKTLNRMAKRKGLEPLAEDIYVFDGFEGFVNIFASLSRYLTEEEDFYEMAQDFAARQAADNVVYTEAFFMPYFHFSGDVPPEAVLRGLEAGLAEGEKTYGITIKLIYDIPRIFGPEPGQKTLGFIEKHTSDRVIGIDLAGMEVPDSIATFADTFERARDMGLMTVAHAGEFSPPEHVWETLKLLKPRRIGHGLSAALDPGLMDYLTDKDIALEISPSSNVKLKAVPSLKEHPVQKFYKAGVPLVINTDDPAIFNTTLVDEYILLIRDLGFSENDAGRLIENSFRYSFLETNEKMRWL